MLGRVREDPADVRVRAERRNQPRVPVFHLLEREPPLLLHQVHEAEVARAQHDDLAVGDVLLRGLLRLGLAGGFADRVADHRVLLVTAAEVLDVGSLDRALDELVQPVAIALLERGALGLAVVGEDDDLVRPRRVPARAVDSRELLVELAERLHRVRALETAVVRDLVVAGERRVDRRAAAHQVGQDAVDDQIADDHAHRGTHERVRTAAVAARTHVAARSLQRGRPLEDELPEEEHERACDVEPVREEPAVAGVRPLLLVDAADGQDHLLGLA